MTKEFDLIRRYFLPIANSIAALGLADDAAVFVPPLGRSLVVTKDMLAAGVHFLLTDPPETIGQKLLRVNLSDLAAMGAEPLGCFLGFGIAKHTDDEWIEGFARGLGTACTLFNCPLLGGDTIRQPDQLTLSLTAIGHVADANSALSRSGAQIGDIVAVTGEIGGAGLGLSLLQSGGPISFPDAVRRYQLPEPRLAAGQCLVGLASAAADVSDGLFADANHIAVASGLAMHINISAIPLAAGVTDALQAATAGDDYELVVTMPPGNWAAALTKCKQIGVRITQIGHCVAGEGVEIRLADGTLTRPAKLGYQHE